jgi:hypothetical protein
VNILWHSTYLVAGARHLFMAEGKFLQWDSGAKGNGVTAVNEDYVTVQSRALLEAVQVEGAKGVGTRSFQLADHLAAEGGIHRGDITAATSLMLSVLARCDGEVEAAARFAQKFRSCGRDSIELVVHTWRLETGRDKGWLPRPQYDALMKYVKQEGRSDMALKALLIEPRDL